MSIHAALFYHVTQAPAVSALMGDRLYPGLAPPEAALPRMTYQRIACEHARHATGGSGLARSRFQFTCWAQSTAAAQALADALRESLDNVRGDMGAPGSTVSVRGCFLEGGGDRVIAPTDGSDQGPFGAVQDVVIWHTESVTG